MGKFLVLIFLIVLSLGVKGQVPSVKGQDDTTKMYPVNYELPGKKAVKINSTTVLLDTDKDNLLVNPSFEHQTATFGWTVTSLATATQSTSDVLEGKKKVCISGVGSIYQLLTDTDKFHGRKFIARLNIQNPNADDGKVCLYDGTELTKCIDTVPSTEFREYVIQDTFISGKTYGFIYTGSALNDSCIDKASIKLDENEAYVANIEGDYQSETMTFSGNVAATTNLASLTVTRSNSNTNSIYTKSSNGITMIRDGSLYVEAYQSTGSFVNMGLAIFLNGTQINRQAGSSNSTSVSNHFRLNAGDVVTFVGTGASNGVISIFAVARSQVINYPDETFSTDINPVYWKATPCGENEIGCYNTYPYPASSNTPGTICTTRPTQTDEDIKLNGFRIYAKSYSGSSSCALPARFKVVIGRGYSYPTIELYKDTGLTNPGFIDMLAVGTYRYGMSKPVYDSKHGTLILDAAQSFDQNSGLALLRFADGTTQNNGYLVISATKNGGALANVPARYLVKVLSGASYEVDVYSDGWTEQRYSVGSGVTTTTLIVPFRDTKFWAKAQASYNGTPGSSYIYQPRVVSPFNTTSVSVSIDSNAGTNWLFVDGYGAASYLWDNFGIKVNY